MDGRKLLAEVDRGLKTYLRYRVWLAADMIATPFWMLFFFLSILFYAPQITEDKAALSWLTWGFFAFLFVSSFVWASNSISLTAQQGILENLILANSNIRTHLVGRLVISAIDILVSGSLLLALASQMFGVQVAVAEPMAFTAALILSFIFFYGFAVVMASVLVAMRSPWLVSNIIQFVIPFTGGAIPVHIMPKAAASAVMMSPFYYAISPIISAATGFYTIDRSMLFLISASLAALMWLVAVFSEKMLTRKALKKGKFTLF